MAIYRSRPAGEADSAAVPDAALPPPSLESKDIPRRLGAHFGLHRLDSNLLADDDSITSIEAVPGKSGRGYIPYSNRRLLWHTDGYYNPETRRIRAFLLHCVQPAAEGGENALLDPEVAYIRLRDANPDYVRALMAPDAMTIPPNTEEGAERPASVGPVFSVDSTDGNLHMRYTARTRSIVWKDNTSTVAAVRFFEQLLADDSSLVLRYRLAAGEGLICNNVLHNRTAFRDNEQGGARRLLYRARYYDRIAGTDTNEIFGT
jgi:alpha-ketoglutarate-dependent taurine dioxygenase